MEPQDSAYLLLGRVEGKVDTLINLHTAQGQRLDGIEARTSQNERDIVTLQTTGTTRQSTLTNAVAVMALAVSAISAYFGMKS